jgi:hypothetical protein
LSRMYDTASTSNSLKNLITAASSKAPRAQVDADLQSVSPSQPAVKRLQVLRNNLFAHTSDRAVRRGKGSIQQDYPLSPADLRMLVRQALRIVRSYGAPPNKRLKLAARVD